MIRTPTFSALALGAVMAMPLGLAAPAPASAQDSPFVSQLALMASSYCPRGWAEANGQLLAIDQHTALFAAMGTVYGGDGRTTFALPDLRGRAPIHHGQGPGLPNYAPGSHGGAPGFTMQAAQMPGHSHKVNAVAKPGDKGGPGDDYLAIPEPLVSNSKNDPMSIYHDGPPDRQMDAGMIASSGGGQAVTHRGPYLAMRWCIALEGLFPPR